MRSNSSRAGRSKYDKYYNPQTKDTNSSTKESKSKLSKETMDLLSFAGMVSGFTNGGYNTTAVKNKED